MKTTPERPGRGRTRITAGLLATLLAWAAAGAAFAQAPDSPLPEFAYDVALAVSERPHVDFVRVNKGERRLDLLSAGVVVRSYEISLGNQPEGPKREIGDGRTPEGVYRIDWRKTDSDYYRALHISYPNAADRARAEARGVHPGGAIMIHGLPNGLGFIGATHTLVDWTDGCIAVTDQEIDEIWEWVADGVTIEILP